MSHIQALLPHPPPLLHVLKTVGYSQEDRSFLSPQIPVQGYAVSTQKMQTTGVSQPAHPSPALCCRSSIPGGMGERIETPFPPHSPYSLGERSPETWQTEDIEALITTPCRYFLGQRLHATKGKLRRVEFNIHLKSRGVTLGLTVHTPSSGLAV